MTTQPDPATPTVDGGSSNGTPATKDEIQADIEATRAQLGETVDLLAQKMDVKTRLKNGAAEASSRLRAQASATSALVRAQAGPTRERIVAQVRANPVVPVGAAAVVAVLATGLVVWRRRS